MMTSETDASGHQESRPNSSLWMTVLAALLTVAGLAVVSSTLAEQKTGAAQEPAATKSDKVPVDETGAPVENPFPDRPKAPELDGGTGWLNTSGEVTLKELRGKIVLLDFWTYCCINCMHVLPDLKYLEHKYPNELVVIGVHSAKFDNEKDSEAIRRAIVRYEIEHPVINDSEMLVWRKFGARAWPTIVLLDPEGNYCGYVSGEGNRELLDTVIQKLIAYHKAKGTLDQSPIQFDLERNRLKSGPLKFPGKILADEAGGRLFISDSNHNRIVISSLDGQLIDVIGSGLIGRKDGGFEDSQFDHPQGMALQGDTLYVADTENHLLRTVDLKTRKVATLAGTGEQAQFRARGGALAETALNSPWDLEIVDGVLYIAMAGPHQIWSHKLGSNQIGVFAGSGREDIIDGPHAEAALAQPSGISSDGTFLYVADSEGSAIRKIPIGTGEITTVVGTHDLPNGRALFEFGDQDGTGDPVRLQHPLGVEYLNGQLFVADAYNHKIKLVDPKTRTSSTWIGTGKMGSGLDPVQLHEPAGLTFAGGRMFVADTNNHRILAIDLKTKQTTEFIVAGLTPPKATGAAPTDALPVAAGKAIALPAQKISGSGLKLNVKLQIPAGYKLNELAPVTVKVGASGEQTLLSADNLAKRHRGTTKDLTAQFEIPLQAASGQANLDLTLTYSYCREGASGVCRLHTTRWTLPLEVAATGGAAQIDLQTDMPKGN